MTDSVGIFHPKDSKPTSTVTREEARAMKARGEAYFINHGRDLRLVSLKPDVKEHRDQRDLDGSMDNWETKRKSWLSPEEAKVVGVPYIFLNSKQYYTGTEL